MIERTKHADSGHVEWSFLPKYKIGQVVEYTSSYGNKKYARVDSYEVYIHMLKDEVLYVVGDVKITENKISNVMRRDYGDQKEQ